MLKKQILLKLHLFFLYLFDLLLLNFIIIILSIPIITIGITLTSAYDVLIRREKNSDSYLIKVFFHSFKKNFIQATVVWMLLLLFNLGNITLFLMYGTGNLFFLVFVIFSFILTCLIYLYIFPLIARYYFDLRKLLATSLYLAMKYWRQTSMLVLLQFVPIFLSIRYIDLFLPLTLISSLFIGFSLSLLISTKILIPIFGKSIK